MNTSVPRKQHRMQYDENCRETFNLLSNLWTLRLHLKLFPWMSLCWCLKGNSHASGDGANLT